MSRFRFLTPAPPPPPLIQAQMGKYFKQENNIVTLKEPYKRGNGWQTNFCLSFVESKSPEREQTRSFCNNHKYYVNIVVLSTNMLLYSFYLWQKAAFPSKYEAWVYILLVSVQQCRKPLLSVSFPQHYHKKGTLKTPRSWQKATLQKDQDLFASNWATTLHCSCIASHHLLLHLGACYTGHNWSSLSSNWNFISFQILSLLILLNHSVLLKEMPANVNMITNGQLTQLAW